MTKKIVFLCFFSIFILVGCSEHSNNDSSVKNSTPLTESEPNDSSSDREKIRLSDFDEINYRTIELSANGEYKIPDFELKNAESIIFDTIKLKKSEKLTLTFQLQSNNSINHMTIGIIKDFILDSESNYEIEPIYSEAIDNELKVTYTSPKDSNYSISILGTMADSVVVKNGKIIKHY